MSFTYRIHEEAQKEYEKAIKWYLKRSLNAAEELKKYPFLIIFAIEAEQETIEVWKIYHKKRNPKKKFRKLK